MFSEGQRGLVRDVEPCFNLFLTLSRSSVYQSLGLSPGRCGLSGMNSLFSPVRRSCWLSGRRSEWRLVNLGFLCLERIDTRFMTLFHFDPGIDIFFFVYCFNLMFVLCFLLARSDLPSLSWCRRRFLAPPARLFGFLWMLQFFNLARVLFLLPPIWFFQTYVMLLLGHAAVGGLLALGSSLRVVFQPAPTDVGSWMDAAGILGPICVYPMWLLLLLVVLRGGSMLLLVFLLMELTGMVARRRYTVPAMCVVQSSLFVALCCVMLVVGHLSNIALIIIMVAWEACNASMFYV